jgi:membrane protease YdiL (CAAX protease family)
MAQSLNSGVCLLIDAIIAFCKSSDISIAAFQGYASAFAVTRRIEAAILTHFAFNAVHFVAFTYPAMAHS